jgi:hypothetical protein
MTIFMRASAGARGAIVNQIDLAPQNAVPKLANQDEQHEVGHYLLGDVARTTLTSQREIVGAWLDRQPSA